MADNGSTDSSSQRPRLRYFSHFAHIVSSHRCYFHSRVFFPNPKSLGNALWQFWVFIFALWTQRVLWENSRCSSGLRVLAKWMPQVIKRDTQRDMYGMCLWKTLCTYLWTFTGFIFKSKRQISRELLFSIKGPVCRLTEFYMVAEIYHNKKWQVLEVSVSSHLKKKLIKSNL